MVDGFSQQKWTAFGKMPQLFKGAPETKVLSY
jgi:hypothetical protein